MPTVIPHVQEQIGCKRRPRFSQLAWMLLFAIGCQSAADNETVQLFERAEETFASAQSEREFLRAASIYEEILNRGVRSGAVLYNQGNAFMRADEKGRAIASYRQAIQYRPRDPYLRSNLNHALSEVAAPSRERNLFETILFWQNWLSYREKFWLAGGLAILTFAVAVASLRLSALQSIARLTVVFAASAIVATVSAGYDWYRFDHLEHGVVVADQVIARKGNSESYEPAFSQPLTEGIEFTVIEHRGDWLLARLSNGLDGWIPRSAAVIY